MSSEDQIEFSAVLDKMESNLWSYHLPVPEPIARFFLDQGTRRVVATLNDRLTYQCALMPKGDGSWFLNVNKKIRTELKLATGLPVHVRLGLDESEYGLPMPEELEELLKLDPEGNELFHALTPGKQRTLLYMTGSPKRPETRIARAITIIEHLKANRGKLDYKQLGEDFRAM